MNVNQSFQKIMEQIAAGLFMLIVVCWLMWAVVWSLQQLFALLGL